MKIPKRSKLIFFILSVSVIGAMAFLYHKHRTSIVINSIPEFQHQPYPGHRVQIQGFHFEGNYEGKKAITITAERFTIEKRNLGLLRFGMLNVAKLKNAVIDIYGQVIKDSISSDQNGHHQTYGRANLKGQSKRGITFANVFKKETLPSFPEKRISSILIDPICLKIHVDNFLITQITATTASIKLKNRHIVFNGDVRVISGENILQTGQLTLIPEKAILQTDHHFIIKTAEKREEGEHLRTDIFLHPVATR